MTTNNATDPTSISPPEGSTAPEPIPEGHRKRTLVSHAGAMWMRGLPPDVVLNAVIALDASHCAPPLGTTEVTRLCQAVFAQPRRGRVTLLDSARGAAATDRSADPPAPDPLTEAVRAKLLAMLASDGAPLTTAQLERVARAAKAALPLLRAVAPRDRVRDDGSRLHLRGPTDDDEDGDDDASDDGPVGPIFAPIAGAPRIETFGSRAIRELVSLLPTVISAQRDTAAGLVAAIAEARRKGMADVAAALETKLLGVAVGPADAPRPVTSTRQERALDPDVRRPDAHNQGGNAAAMLVNGAAGAATGQLAADRAQAATGGAE